MLKFYAGIRSGKTPVYLGQSVIPVVLPCDSEYHPFLKNYRVIALDNRGTGPSDKPDIPYTMEMMTANTAGLFDTIGVSTVHLFGVSIGGFITQHFALQYPEKVASLILDCTYPTVNLHRSRYFPFFTDTLIILAHRGILG
jgi:pimeloyl-ACP methyl ester carboxylesterase